MAASSRLLGLLLLLFACVSSANGWNSRGWGLPRGRRETNGQRLSRGLSPLPPRRLYNATRTGPELARRSVVPVTNTIAVTAVGSGAPFCWIATSGVCQTTPSFGEAFTASVGQGAPGAQELDIVSGQFSGYDLVAYSSTTPIQGSSNPGSWLGVETFNNLHSNPGDTPIFNQTNQLYYESAIWKVDSSGRITASWINPNGDVIPLTFYTRSSGGITYTYATGDLADLSGMPTQVTLAFS